MNSLNLTGQIKVQYKTDFFPNLTFNFLAGGEKMNWTDRRFSKDDFVLR